MNPGVMYFSAFVYLIACGVAGVANENFHAFSVPVEINQDYYCQNLRLCTGDGRIPVE